MIIRNDGTYERSDSALNYNWYEDEDNFIIDETTIEGKEMTDKYVENYPFVDFRAEGEYVVEVILLEKPEKPPEMPGKRVELSQNAEGDWEYVYVDIPLTREKEVEILKAQNTALSDRTDFLEDVIAEMAMMIYD